jgi:hypothetical protein
MPIKFLSLLRTTYRLNSNNRLKGRVLAIVASLLVTATLSTTLVNAQESGSHCGFRVNQWNPEQGRYRNLKNRLLSVDELRLEKLKSLVGTADTIVVAEFELDKSDSEFDEWSIATFKAKRKLKGTTESLELDIRHLPSRENSLFAPQNALGQPLVIPPLAKTEWILFLRKPVSDKGVWYGVNGYDSWLPFDTANIAKVELAIKASENHNYLAPSPSITTFNWEECRNRPAPIFKCRFVCGRTALKPIPVHLSKYYSSQTLPRPYNR